MAPPKLFSCFTASVGGVRDGTQIRSDTSMLEIQRINNRKSFEKALQRARMRGCLVACCWAANWCSLSLEADVEFAHLAASLAREQPGRVKFVRVNLDKADDLALEYKVITLPSFSIFQDGQLVEHYTGLESCRLMHSRLQCDVPIQDDMMEGRRIDTTTETPDIATSSSREPAEWDACATSTSSSDCTEYTGADISPSYRSTSLEWNSYGSSQYLTRYKLKRGSVDGDKGEDTLGKRRHSRQASA